MVGRAVVLDTPDLHYRCVWWNKENDVATWYDSMCVGLYRRANDWGMHPNHMYHSARIQVISRDVRCHIMHKRARPTIYDERRGEGESEGSKARRAAARLCLTHSSTTSRRNERQQV